jgi:PIN domain nuclease of toxin-antitoxin system
VRILLDTHCWLWSYFEPEKLNVKAVSVLEDLDHEVFFSIASSWEIAIQYQIGKTAWLARRPLPVLASATGC